uniref:Sperm associated antigen 5 n=1 Tax=Acanthochromis polyacanthus TaxID=80966 RepID=A0A3Q1EGB6_9TELE
MSSKKSSSSGEDPPLSRTGERTPLRSLDNESLHLSTPSSRFKSRSQLSTAAVKKAMVDIPLSNQDPHLHCPSTGMIQTNPSTTDMTTAQTDSGLGDVTFKSFTCAGGEVEIPDSSLCTEENFLLPNDQATYNNESEDSVASHSMTVQSCSEHIEHPYHNPEMKESYSVDVSATCLRDIPNTTLTSGDQDDKQATQDLRDVPNDCCEEKYITWKSFVEDMGEVEVSDATKLQDETIPLPKTGFCEPLQDNSVNLTRFSVDSSQLCQVEHADHPYCSNEKPFVPVINTSSEITSSDNLSHGLSDVTFKSFNCAGGEIEISECTKSADETVPLPANHTVANNESYCYDVDPSVQAGADLQNCSEHLDHPYCDVQNYSSPLPGNFSATQESFPCNIDAVSVKQRSLMIPDNQASSQESGKFSCFFTADGEVEKSDDVKLFEKTSCPLKDQVVDHHSVCTSVTQHHIQDDYKQPNSHLENDEAVADTDPSAVSGSSLTTTSLKALDNEAVQCEEQEKSKHTIQPEDKDLHSVVHRTEISDCSHHAALAESPTPGEVQQHLEHVSQMYSTQTPSESSEAKDSALGPSGNGPALCNSAEVPPAENFADVLKVLSECPSAASALEILTPVIRRASQYLLKDRGNPTQYQFLSDDSALEGEKSFLGPVNINPTGLFADHLDSPIPCPLFNSTALGAKPSADPVTEPVENLAEKLCAAPQSKVEKPVLDVPLIPDGPLQQQLRQMAEFLLLASGKMGLAGVSASVAAPTAFMAPSAGTPPAESYSVCVGTSPVKLVDHSLNTSGLFERKREFTVVDACTVTDPILWNLLPGSLECLPRPELEQRLKTSMIMVEALVQQLATARAQGCPSAGPAPSDLREKLVQTDHTELSQTTMHRDLYLEALSRISELELDGSSLQNLMQCMQDMRITLTSLSGETDAALSNMKETVNIVKEDHESLVSHYGHMKSLFEKSKETQIRMIQKVKDALHQRNDMRIQMEEAFAVKEAAFSAMDQLRTHCAAEISALEKSVGCQQELLAALHQTYPEQVALNKTCSETLTSASDLLSQTMEEQSSLMKELSAVRSLLQKAAPMLLKLNEKAAAALRERDEHISARDQANEEREQIEEELNEAHLNLQTAREQIGDLSLQVTILSSEMGVLRQKLTEKEEETGQLERKVTELSATVSSSLASYTFLEQALAAESTKLQQSWKDIQQANERANELEASLGQSEERECELSRALAQSEEQLSQLQILSQSQSLQIQQLQEVCTQLKGVREMNEFLQMENELAREQVAESERLLRESMQGLRERNIECEDLKGELCQLQLENGNLQEELETTRTKASATQLELGEKMAQAVTDITLLHHTLRGLTNELHAALSDQKPELRKDEEPQPVCIMERRHFSSSFVDSIMVALAAEKEEDAGTGTRSDPSDTPEPQCDTLFSQTSAFTRIAAVTPKKNLNAEEEQQSSVAELLADLDSTVTELVRTMKLVQQRKDAQLEELHSTVCGLQAEQQAANIRHEAEVCELKHQLSRLNNLAERGNQALQQKEQDEKTVTKLIAEVQEAQEILNKHKTDNSDLRKDVTELRRALQQSKVESQFLREEMRKAGSQSATPTHYMEEKIQLLKEVQRLKVSLQEAEQARVKLLERAKRHQVIHQTNQQKSENELQILNNMINKVREVRDAFYSSSLLSCL